MFVNTDNMVDMLVVKCFGLRMLECSCSVRLHSQECLMVVLLLSLTDNVAKDVKLSTASILALLSG